MRELRLVPPALAVWAAALITLLWDARPAFVAVGVVAGAMLVLRQLGQAVLVAGLGFCSAFIAAMRVAAAEAFEPGDTVHGKVAGAPVALDSGGFLVRLNVTGHPGSIAVFTRDLPPGVVSGARVSVAGTVGESDVPGTAKITLSGAVDVLGPPEGMAALAGHVRTTFADAVAQVVGPGSQGLIPGMVLGDTSLQDAAEKQAYIDTGLSHLSAVSGSNIAIVTTAAVLAASALRLGLRARIAAAGVVLMVYAALVGPEPSVLRATVTGLVALVAVVSSSIAEPVHTLCLSVVALVLVDTNMAVSFGFALSVAATAGIVALSPLLYRALAVLAWPDVLIRAVAVALAADIVTMPLIALMVGQVSLVAVAANVLVAPLAAPITVLGLVATLLSLLPGGLEVPVLLVIEPMAWWVHAVAAAGARLPGAVIAASPIVVVVGYGWVVAGLVAKRPWLTLAATVCVLAVVARPEPAPPEVDPAGKKVHVVQAEEDIEPVPAGTEVVVVLDTGRAKKRSVSTPQGVPVIYPNRGVRASG